MPIQRPNRGARTRAHLGGEDGIALIVAIQILAIMTMLVLGVLGATLSLNNTTKRDYNSKSALAAALSGLDVARYRLTKVVPARASCLTDTTVATGSGGAAAG